MSLTFAYKLRRLRRPVETLGGRWVIPRPLIEFSLQSPLNTIAMQGCLDTGSDECYFCDVIAEALGFDISNARAGIHRGIDGLSHQVRYADVKFRLSDGRTRLEWPATVGFTTAPLRFALLGFAGFLQYFTAKF